MTKIVTTINFFFVLFFSHTHTQIINLRIIHSLSHRQQSCRVDVVDSPPITNNWGTFVFESKRALACAPRPVGTTDMFTNSH